MPAATKKRARAPVTNKGTKNGKNRPIKGDRVVDDAAGTTKKSKGKKIRKSVHYRYRSGKGHIQVGKGTLDLLEGKVDVTTWTEEELIRGAPMTSKVVPHVIPLKVHQELMRRVMAESRHHMAAELEYAVMKHMQIIQCIDPTDPTSPQVKALEMLYDRVLGKPDEHITHSLDETQFMKAFAHAIVGTDEQAEKTIIDIGEAQKELSDGHPA